jgi:hypothetical protein
MQRITLVVRKAGSLDPDYSLKFEVPSLPRVGTYLSIHRDDLPEPFGEDVIVRQVWWQMEHPAAVGAEGTVGGVTEIVVECAKAIGPYSSEAWRESLRQAEELGAEVEEFEVSRPQAGVGRGRRRQLGERN